jgi:hypothetical protein
MNEFRAVHRRDLRSLLFALPLIALLGALIAANADSLGGWGTLAALVLAAAVLAAAGLAVRVREWRRPFTWKDLESEVVREGLDPAKLETGVSPLEVESALRRLMASWARELDHSDSATVLIHPHLHTDYDARVVDHDGDEQDVRVYLLQAKARPVPSTLRHFAKTMAREDASEAVMITTLSSFQKAYSCEIGEMAEGLGIRLISVGALHDLVHGGNPTVEIYVEGEPPSAEAPVLITR